MKAIVYIVYYFHHQPRRVADYLEHLVDAPLQKYKKALLEIFEYYKDSYCKTTGLGGSINENFNCYI